MNLNRQGRRGHPGFVRRGGVGPRAALIGALVGLAMLLATLIAAVVPSGGMAAYLGPLAAKSGKHKHHDSDEGSSQTLSTDGSDVHNSGCTKVVHSFDDLDSALNSTESDGGSRSVCVQIVNQSVNNTGGWADFGGHGSGDDQGWSDDGDN